MQIVSKQLYSIKQGNSVSKYCSVLLWPDETSSLKGYPKNCILSLITYPHIICNKNSLKHWGAKKHSGLYR